MGDDAGPRWTRLEGGYDWHMTLRQRLAWIFLSLVLAGLPAHADQTQTKPAQPAATDARVFLTPTCGCCRLWTDHMAAAKFNVTRDVMPDLQAVPHRKRVPSHLQACHTALVGDYIVEGHVPADVVRQMLKDKPKIAGISVPGMPIGSPGMEGAYVQSYSIIAFRSDGTTYEFARR
jgi:hypothetical protein